MQLFYWQSILILFFQCKKMFARLKNLFKKSESGFLTLF
nr:MAG TPA: hypothetical protein [Caudoviricetes sp.]